MRACTLHGLRNHVHDMLQQPNSKGLLSHGLGNLVGDVLLEVPVWTRLARPVPTPVQDLAEQAEKLRTTSASVTAIVRTYNKVRRLLHPQFATT